MSSSSTAEGIFSKMQEALSKYDISLMGTLCGDKTSVNMGCNNSIKTRVEEMNAAVAVIGLSMSHCAKHS